MPAERFPTSEIAQVEIYGRMGRISSRMKNLSVTGALFEFQHGDFKPQKGDLIRVTIPLRSLGITRVISGEVMWSLNMNFGICFLKEPELLEKMFLKNSNSGPT